MHSHLPTPERDLAGLAERDREAACPVTILAHDIGPVGGMERQLTELATGLRERGHRVRVIARSCQLPPDSGVEFIRVWFPRRPFLVGYAWSLLFGSLALRRHRLGVVHMVGAIALGRVDTIAVHCCHQVYSAGPASGSLPRRLYGSLLRSFKRVVERRCFAANDEATFVCVSDGVASEVREHFPRLTEHVVTIHNGVDLERFAPGRRRLEARSLAERLGIAPERLTVVFAGGNWEDKGLANAIEALAGAPRWDLLVAGRGNRRPFEELASRLGVADRVHWLGLVREIEDVYELADAFVLPSRYETFSLVTFEAAAEGLPILATPVSGVGELLVDGGNGFLITADGEAIAARLRRLEDPAVRQRLGAAARESVLGFTWTAMVSAHDELYTRIDAGRDDASA